MPSSHPIALAAALAAGAALLSGLAALTSAAPTASLLLCIPVLLASKSGTQRSMRVAAAGAICVLLLAALDAALAGPARTSAYLTPLLALAASAAVAHRLAGPRIAPPPHAVDSARADGETNRLLLSLLAHDLRSPLVLADQGLQYVEESVSGGYPIDRSLLADLRARLQRSLRAIGLVLTLARSEAEDATPAEAEPVALRDTIGAEVASFRYEAEARGKWLIGELDDLPADPFLVDTLVLRQGIAIAVDNAIRYADPGPIRVRAWLASSALEVRVEDSGPGLGSTEADPDRAHGSGLGLRLCSALLRRAGGSLDVERDSPAGTVIALRIPVAPMTTRAVRIAREHAPV